MARRWLSKPILCKAREKQPTQSDQGLHPPTFPCPTLSTREESQKKLRLVTSQAEVV